MKRCRLLNIFAVLFLLSKLTHAADTLYCPAGYVLWNGLCYLNNQYACAGNCLSATTTVTPIEETATNSVIDLPVTTETTPIIEPTTNSVIDLPLTTEKSPTEATTTKSVTDLPDTSTDRESIPAARIRCPPGSIFFNEQCRQIICPLGEFIAGRCFQITCPSGMVWREHSCREPEYITTILQIDNVFLSEAHESHGNITHVNTNNLDKVTNSTTNSIIATTTTPPPLLTIRPTTTRRPSAALIRPDCCMVHSPRLCKNYQKKWVCFNHRHEFCDPKVCEFPTMYLRTPKIAYTNDLLIMPPHPPLKACQERGCDSENTVDCSGCVRGEKENCSPYCYYYYCPEDSCGYMDLRDFCQIHPNHPLGCNQDDGCIWFWCGGRKTL